MSANNVVIIDSTTFKVYHFDMDNYLENGVYNKPVAEGKNLEDAHKKAVKWYQTMQDNEMGYFPLEYGIQIK